jgi:hypothetical protein
MNIHRYVALSAMLFATAACGPVRPPAAPAPDWMVGHYKGHNVRAPSYPIEMVVDSSGRVVITNATNTVQGQFSKGDLVVWGNGKTMSSVRQSGGDVVMTQTDDTSNVEVFQRQP